MHKRISGLDLIRGLAIGLVLLRHSWPDVFGSAGIVGVVIFFSLSGYLITGVILRDIREKGGLRYGRFYRNRALRLIPPLLAFVVTMCIVSIVADPIHDRDSVWKAATIALTYTANIPIEQGSPAISHLWTLATEEQFYIVWPMIVAFAFRRRRLPTAVWVVSLAILACLALTAIVTNPAIERIYRLPTSWSIAMVIGASAQIFRTQLKSVTERFARFGTTGAAASALFLFSLAFMPEGKAQAVSYFVIGPLVAILTVGLIWFAKDWEDVPHAALRPLLFLGTISYAAYLWNLPLILWLHPLLGQTWTPALGIVATLLVATGSWFFIERPVQRWREKHDAKLIQRTPATSRNPNKVQ